MVVIAIQCLFQLYLHEAINPPKDNSAATKYSPAIPTNHSDNFFVIIVLDFLSKIIQVIVINFFCQFLYNMNI